MRVVASMTSIPVATHHILDLRTVGPGSSYVEVRFDGGPWTRSIIASLWKTVAMWMDTSEESIGVAWLATTGVPLEPR